MHSSSPFSLRNCCPVLGITEFNSASGEKKFEFSFFRKQKKAGMKQQMQEE
jgi:hypothetical protein